MNAREWLARAAPDRPDIAVLGVPISRASISPSQAWSTPPAFRAALQRFPTWNAAADRDLGDLSVLDAGDVQGDREDPDAAPAHRRIEQEARRLATRARSLVVIGGDNSLTAPAMRGVMAAQAAQTWGLVTLDAHHDCRPLEHGPRNGTPVRELIEGGLPGERVVQIGIHPQANERAHAQWAGAQGVHVFRVDAYDWQADIETVVGAAAHELDRRGVTAVYLDIDVDVVDRAHAPACPASLPGGLQPAHLLELVRRIAAETPLVAADITEVDANADIGGITVRLAAAAFLNLCAGLAMRWQPR